MEYTCINRRSICTLVLTRHPSCHLEETAPLCHDCCELVPVQMQDDPSVGDGDDDQRKDVQEDHAQQEVQELGLPEGGGDKSRKNRIEYKE